MGNENSLNVKTQDDIDLEYLQEEEDNIRARISEIRSEIKKIELKKNNLDQFKNKYVEYEEDGIKYYLYVGDIYAEKNMYTNFDFCYALKGYGFSGEFTGYYDATWFYCDYSYVVYVYGMMNELQSKVRKIKIITKEEFDQKFKEYFESVMDFHKKQMNFSEK